MVNKNLKKNFERKHLKFIESEFSILISLGRAI